MATSILHLQVADYAVWRPVFDNYAHQREQFGCLDERVLHDPMNPNQVTVVLEWESLTHAQTHAKSPELRAAMQEAGVMGPPSVHFLEDAP